MSNKLFIVCPFSCMETFLQKKYGEDIFFLTFCGSVFQQQELNYLSAVNNFILQEEIKTVYVVNDTSCRFIDAIINKKKLVGLPAEKEIEALYIDNYFSVFKDKSLAEQQYNLAKLNINNQVNKILSSSIIGKSISENNIQIKGIVTSKKRNSYNEINLENNKMNVYEL